ncbi:MAG: sulfotransferase [Hyellaceae cyanobacterium CSU_1_1]|nr:sulfotransferase [Hyellaceae cyanobacterium CSU_1_1]
MNKPSFFIVGNPKSGTTALYNFLKEHPSIFMPKCKEPHYFAKDLCRVPNQQTVYYPMNKQEYYTLFNEAKKIRYVEKLVLTTYILRLQQRKFICLILKLKLLLYCENQLIFTIISFTNLKKSYSYSRNSQEFSKGF